MNKKKLIILISALVLLSIILIVIFSNKTSKETKMVEDENNYSLKFDYYIDKKINQTATFIYRDKKLKDITLTLYFDNKDIAKAVYNEYKSNKEFKDYKLDKKNVILYYKDSDVKGYKSYTKDDIIAEFTSLGYTYKK